MYRCCFQMRTRGPAPTETAVLRLPTSEILAPLLLADREGAAGPRLPSRQAPISPAAPGLPEGPCEGTRRLCAPKSRWPPEKGLGPKAQPPLGTRRHPPLATSAPSGWPPLGYGPPSSRKRPLPPLGPLRTPRSPLTLRSAPPGSAPSPSAASRRVRPPRAELRPRTLPLGRCPSRSRMLTAPPPPIGRRARHSSAKGAGRRGGGGLGRGWAQRRCRPRPCRRSRFLPAFPGALEGGRAASSSGRRAIRRRGRTAPSRRRLAAEFRTRWGRGRSRQRAARRLALLAARRGAPPALIRYLEKVRERIGYRGYAPRCFPGTWLVVDGRGA